MKDLMVEGESPNVARRHVRMALRSARESAGLTQAEVAEEMEWSVSKVIRIENGDNTIAPNDLKPLLTFLRVKDRAVVAELVAAAKIARSRQQAWYQAKDYRDNLTDTMRKYFEYEAEATFIHSYSVFHVPGLLQVPSYAMALTETWAGELSQDQIEFRVRARAMRQETVLERVDGLRFNALVDESVFMRPIGGTMVLAAQLRELLRLADTGVLFPRVIRFDTPDVVSWNAAGFDIMFLGADGDLSNAVMYRENALFDEIVEDVAIGRAPSLARPPSGLVARHYDRFQKLWSSASSESDTIAFIRERLQQMGG